MQELRSLSRSNIFEPAVLTLALLVFPGRSSASLPAENRTAADLIQPTPICEEFNPALYSLESLGSEVPLGKKLEFNIPSVEQKTTRSQDPFAPKKKRGVVIVELSAIPQTDALDLKLRFPVFSKLLGFVKKVFMSEHTSQSSKEDVVESELAATQLALSEFPEEHDWLLPEQAAVTDTLRLDCLSSNPCRSGQVEIKYEANTADPLKLELFDVQGRRLAHQPIESVSAEPQSGLAKVTIEHNGCYFLVLSSPTAQQSLKLIVAR